MPLRESTEGPTWKEPAKDPEGDSVLPLRAIVHNESHVSSI